jgi:curli biogenesis system outer membrane secretion channel CsgG
MRCRSTQLTIGAAALLVLPAAASPLLAQNDKLEKCATPVGTLAVVEPEDQTIHALKQYSLSSPTSLIRMMIQQSNCFRVVERGAGMASIQRERELARGGELQQSSNVGGGQMVAADYVLTPHIIFSEGNAGGIGGAAAGLMGRRLGAVAGGLKFKEAQTSMLIADTRTGIQVAAAEGKARKKDFALGALGWAGGAVGAVGGYTNTNEGKVIAASFLDNYNNIVVAVRSDPNLAAAKVASAGAPKAGAVYADGDVVLPKIDNIKLLADPDDAAKVLGMLAKSTELVYLGEEKGGFMKVQAATGAGWVKSVLVSKR